MTHWLCTGVLVYLVILVPHALLCCTGLDSANSTIGLLSPCLVFTVSVSRMCLLLWLVHRYDDNEVTALTAENIRPRAKKAIALADVSLYKTGFELVLVFLLLYSYKF